MMRKRENLLGLGLILLFGIASSGTSPDGNPSAHDIYEKRIFPLGGSLGDIYVIVRTDGHTHPHTIELRPNCGNRKVSFLKLEIAESRGVCRYVKNSIKFNKEKSELTAEIFEVDSDKVNARTLKGLPIKFICEKKSVPISFDTRSLCGNNNAQAEPASKGISRK